MIDKILNFFSGFNGTKTMHEVKRDTRRNVMALLYQQVKRNTPGVMREWSILGSLEHAYGIADVASLTSRLQSGEQPELKVGDSGSFVDRIVLHQVVTRDNKIVLHIFKDTKYSNGTDDYLTTVEIQKKFPTDHLPKESKVLEAR